MRARDKGRVHYIRLDKSLDSSEFFKGHQVVRSPKKALKRPKKGNKMNFKKRV